MKTDEEMKHFAAQVARKQGWSVNSDAEFVSDVLSGLAKNNERYDFFLCPCRDSWGSREKDRDIKCPCIYAKTDILEYDRCYCGLFVKRGKAGIELEIPVPDRRPDEFYPD